MSISNREQEIIDFELVEHQGVYPSWRGSGSSFTPNPRGAKNLTVSGGKSGNYVLNSGNKDHNFSIPHSYYKS